MLSEVRRFVNKKKGSASSWLNSVGNIPIQWKGAIFFGVIVFVTACFLHSWINQLHFNNSRPFEKITIRVNTFRRLDSLSVFLKHHAKCDIVSQIQVVWSDQKNKPPLDWLSLYPQEKVKFEIHDKDSLNNRFKPLLTIPTQAVLSIDDDIVIPCDEMKYAVAAWASNKSGGLRYLNWQYTWWTGAYTIMLTKMAIFDKKYLEDFSASIPSAFLDYVDKSRNCEDIAMAYVVAKQSQAAPVWVSLISFEIGGSGAGISSGSTHFSIRSQCLEKLQELLDPDDWQGPWVTGYQKLVPFSSWDYLSAYRDIK